jgi:hypothetical protein
MGLLCDRRTYATVSNIGLMRLRRSWQGGLADEELLLVGEKPYWDSQTSDMVSLLQPRMVWAGRVR